MSSGLFFSMKPSCLVQLILVFPLFFEPVNGLIHSQSFLSSPLYSEISFPMQVLCGLNQSLFPSIGAELRFVPDTSQGWRLVPYLYCGSQEPQDWTEGACALWGRIEQFPPTNSSERKSKVWVCSWIPIHSMSTTYWLCLLSVFSKPQC